jgi:ribosomal protein S18 acetylase RimI-like enzyme
MNIRSATVADAGSLAELGAIVQALHYEHRPDVFKPADPLAARPLYERLLADPSVRAFLVEAGGQKVGYVIVHIISAPDTPLTRAATVVDIDQVGVHPHARRQGVGRALLDRVKALAEEIGADRLQLTVWEFNEPAQRFFAAQGLEVAMRRMTALTAWIEGPPFAAGLSGSDPEALRI